MDVNEYINHLNEQIEIKKQEWETKYKSLLVTIESSHNDDGFERNAINQLMQMNDIKLKIKQLEEITMALKIYNK